VSVGEPGIIFAILKPIETNESVAEHRRVANRERWDEPDGWNQCPGPSLWRDIFGAEPAAEERQDCGGKVVAVEGADWEVGCTRFAEDASSGAALVVAGNLGPGERRMIVVQGAAWSLYPTFATDAYMSPLKEFAGSGWDRT
jgi:hypothetical protein